VLSTSEYEFKDRDDGREVRGVNFQFVTTKDLKPKHDGNGRRGYVCTKGTLPKEKAVKFIEVPALYDVKFEMTPDSKGKLNMKATDVEFLSAIEVMT
jgi:hypothetical protein